MASNETEAKTTDADHPRRIFPAQVAERYGCSARTGGEWLRAMVASGVIRKLRAMHVGRWSAIDAWVEGGGVVPDRGRKNNTARG